MKPLLFMVFSVLFVSEANGARILTLPFDHQAHVNFYSIIGEELLARGHQVDIIVAERSEHLAKKRGLNTIVVPFEKTLDYKEFEHVASLSPLKQIQGLRRFSIQIAMLHTRHIMNDEALLGRLKAANYDLAIIEGFDPARSLYLLPYKLGLKYISVDVRHDPLSARVPALPSVEGVHGLFYLDENSTFVKRILNTFAFAAFHLLVSPPSYFTGISGISDELVPEMPNVGFEKLFQDSEMFLVVMDNICTDAHRVYAPHFQFVGGLGARDAEPLPNDLKKFVEAAHDGIIVVTFGPGLKRIPTDILEKMLPVFKDLKQKVIVRHDGDKPSFVPSNVLIQGWLPQNDLLGHPNTKLFVTHVGNNGQLESVYHGVPMLMMPFLGDQFYNTLRAVKRGYGLQLNPHDFTTNEFNETILELLHNPGYSNNIKKCSNILHSLPSPQHTAAFWIEHILQFGGSHLKPYYMDMPLWKFFMFDIILFLIALDLTFVFVVWYCCRKCRGGFKSSKSKKE